ncbi:hypothetical protein MWU57_00640 [Isoptericola sp. S6320L]|uniref:hypothetical protein n=1 Tax=Isoptericola sp. S6320L TaxID=2926411 RepID=UPI001FF386A4|nr:hypothetical protein [Isoptericola sp. S6320L]MCK0115530.1 hypothetical protein [Isoptericola sp. S6320L]
MNVYVVLSCSTTVLSRAIRWATGAEFTHAALALDPELEDMFSFGRRRAGNPFVGCFKRERIDDELYRRMPVLPGAVIEVPVTAQQREVVDAQVARFALDSGAYSYNHAGLVGRGSESSTRFVCSEFVYHVLRSAGVCDLGVPRWKVSPQMLLRVPGDMVFRGDLKQYRPLTLDGTRVRIAA